MKGCNYALLNAISAGETAASLALTSCFTALKAARGEDLILAIPPCSLGRNRLSPNDVLVLRTGRRPIGVGTVEGMILWS